MIDHWWQTETGWAIAANPAGIELLPVKPGSPTVPMPGYDVQILSESGTPLPPGELGAVAVKLPLPPGTLPTLWNADERFVKSYLASPGYYETGDAGVIDEDGYVHIMARTDDVINVAGHRLSTGAMEECAASHPDVAECAVVGVADALKGQLPLGFLPQQGLRPRPRRHRRRMRAAGARPHRAGRRLQDRDRRRPAAEDPLGQDPARRHGAIADGRDWKAPATIDDPAILAEIGEGLARIGYGHSA